MTPATARVLDALGEAFQAAAGPALVPLVGALADPLDVTEARVRTTSGGWPAAFDLEQTPDPAWLGRIVGSPPPAGATVDQARAYIRDRPYWRRGSPAAMRAAVQPLLAPGGRVVLIERDGSPWRLTVRAFRPDVPAGVTAADLKRAAETQKPVGIVLDAEIVDGATYQHMATEHGPTYADTAAAFPSYATATNHLPENGTLP